MNEPRVDDTFITALRHVLVEQVDASVRTTRRKHRRLWLGVGVFAGAGLLGGIGAASAGILVLPGGDAVTPLAAPMVGTYTGPATVDLGPVPKGATNIALELTCLSPGRFVFDDGSSVVCFDSDIGTRSASTGYSVPIVPGQHTVIVSTDATVTWALEATYVQQTITAWGTNPHGESYGIQNVHGIPDLIAAEATNGKTGYVRVTDLEQADGTTASKSFKGPAEALVWQKAHQGVTTRVPVYESDGTTVVGEFTIGSR